MSAHTQGPWHTAGWEVHDRVQSFDSAGARTGNTPNSICLVHETWDAKGKANARLIAAAPQLVEALERLTRIAAVDFEKSRPDVIEQARAALTAAGVTP